MQRNWANPSRMLAALVAVAMMVTGGSRAFASEVKPYIFMILDTSGSMDDAPHPGPASCAGAGSTKIDNAKCAIQKIALSYAELILGLGIFRQVSGNQEEPTCGNAPNNISCSSFNTVCTTDGDSLQIVTPMYEGNQGDVIKLNNMSCSTCDLVGADPEIRVGGGTPLGGVLDGAKRYFRGQASPSYGHYVALNAPGGDPIRNDPLKDIFDDGAQCRPYIVILLTDGEEYCGGDAPARATSLLSTEVDGQNYRIETRPIGFGISPGNAAIEAIAHAGGRPDVANQNEGYYAANEEELQLAISDIVAESIKFEQCNGEDDDCDTLVDEDFPNLNDACHDNGIGQCRGSGFYVCNGSGNGTTCQVTVPGASPVAETCDGLDNDCDTKIDEGGVCSGCSNVEVCNNLDDDCDGHVDENLTRSCGTDVGECNRGTETCVAGAWQGCSAVGGGPEVCDGLDNNCDGLTDGFSRPCSNMVGGNPNVGICHPGTQICPADGSGQFLACSGEVTPQPEVCDGLDNDCDTIVDEGTGGNACDASCGAGVTICVSGHIECQNGTAGIEVCNGFDDDCDNNIDEGALGGEACDAGGTICNGTRECISGGLVCVGAPIGVETCNCEDDDCDDNVDENPGSLCQDGSQCVQCECAFECSPGEFPCPIGRNCIDGFCITDKCFGITCEPLPGGDATMCVEGECLRACDITPCGVGTVCVPELGECRFDDCRTFPDRCSASETCIAGTCVDDPCAQVACQGGQYCSGGACVASCAGVNCGTGRRCELGACVTDPCGGPCVAGEVCNDAAGICVEDLCGATFECDIGLACNPLNGLCEPDPCATVTCPGEDQVCYRGSCYNPEDLAPASQRVTVAGKKGCSTQPGASTGWLALALAGMLASRRRRRGQVEAGQ